MTPTKYHVYGKNTLTGTRAQLTTRPLTLEGATQLITRQQWSKPGAAFELVEHTGGERARAEKQEAFAK